MTEMERDVASGGRVHFYVIIILPERVAAVATEIESCQVRVGGEKRGPRTN